MLLTLTTTHDPATDLGYLLHKSPGRVHTFDLAFGAVQVFYPVATQAECTAALLMEVDPVRLVQGKRTSWRKYDYVNDRPYVASSLMSVAISQVYGSALSGVSRERPDLVDAAIPLRAQLDVVRCRGGEPFLRRVFEPLGYSVTVETYQAPASPVEFFSLGLERACPLKELLEHLYVLIPVLDDDKHYWVGEDEVEKLLRRGGDWLPAHPARDQIVDRYLKHRAPLRRQALAQLIEAEGSVEGEEPAAGEGREDALEAPIRLHDQRLQAVTEVLKERGAHRVLDLGCGEGRLIALLLKEASFTEIAGVEVSSTALTRAEQRLRLDQMPARQAVRLKLLLGSLTYRDRRLEGYDAAAVVEVIEHLDPPRLAAFERVLFEYARPGCVVMTTPNAEYNVRLPSLPSGEFRHPDHRFEWSRAEFEAWCASVTERHGYQVAIRPIGPVDPDVGAPTQMAVFSL